MKSYFLRHGLSMVQFFVSPNWGGSPPDDMHFFYQLQLQLEISSRDLTQ